MGTQKEKDWSISDIGEALEGPLNHVGQKDVERHIQYYG